MPIMDGSTGRATPDVEYVVWKVLAALDERFAFDVPEWCISGGVRFDKPRFLLVHVVPEGWVSGAISMQLASSTSSNSGNRLEAVFCRIAAPHIPQFGQVLNLRLERHPYFGTYSITPIGQEDREKLEAIREPAMVGASI